MSCRLHTPWTHIICYLPTTAPGTGRRNFAQTFPSSHPLPLLLHPSIQIPATTDQVCLAIVSVPHLAMLRSALLQLLLLSAATGISIPHRQQALGQSSKNYCPLAPKVTLPDDGLYSHLRFVEEDSYRSRQVDRLAKAVQVPTVVGDQYTGPYDPLFKPFVEFHQVLESLFPLVYVRSPS